jgi:Carboxypeptidase regulatory-like domain
MGSQPATASRTTGLLILLLCLSPARQVVAQGGDGSLRGTVRDSQGGALPGVTVTATSAMMLSPSVTVTDGSGNYRLINLPPGTFKVTAELAGFSQFQREGILLRAASNFQVDITMEIGAVSETVTVSGDPPMLEVSKPGGVLTIDAEFQKEAPVVEGKFWSDFLMLTPGVISRPHNDASGRQNYFGNVVEHRDAVTLMEGLYAGNYNDFNINRTGLSSEAIQDTEVKTGGVDAASPMGYGLVINMVHFAGTPITSRQERPQPARSISTMCRLADQSGKTRPGFSARFDTPTTKAGPGARPSNCRITRRSSPTERSRTIRSPDTNLRQECAVPEQRLHSRRAEDGESCERRRRDAAVPPAVRHR